MTDAANKRDRAAPAASPRPGRTIAAVGKSVIGKPRTTAAPLEREIAFHAGDAAGSSSSVLSVGAPASRTLHQLARAILLKRHMEEMT
jgi:hypothetical protein